MPISLPFSRLLTSFFDPSTRIDRFLADRAQRLAAGIFVPDDFSSVIGTLLVVRGRGKFLRIKHVSSSAVEIPAVVGQQLKAIVDQPNLPAEDVKAAIDDLTGIQLKVISDVKNRAGKYVDRLLTLSVHDPGMWATDFDGRPSFTPLCSSATLAEKTGITVVDAFPLRDLAAGGNGRMLDAVPLWLLLGDRNEKVATENNAIVIAGPHTLCYQLPASDGLDAELPAIDCAEIRGITGITTLIEQRHREPMPAGEISRLYAAGKFDDQLAKRWTALPDTRDASGKQTQLNPSSAQPDTIAPVAEQYLGSGGSIADLLTTAVKTHARAVVRCLRSLSGSAANFPTTIHLNSGAEVHAALINALSGELPTTSIQSTTEAGMEGPVLSATTTAILGLMNIDQLPANIPWITGADSQRILGRLTPGSAANWRQLILDMADFQPPAMKLRDAM